MNLPRQGRGLVHSYFFKVTRHQGDLTRIMGPYPTIQSAIAAREILRSAGYFVGEIGNN